MPANDPLVGDVLDGRYEVLARLARGGMATVYRAWDRRLERIVAIKVMHEGLGDDADFAAKFDREARAAARLCDQSVVSIFDQGHDHGRPYIVMEFVEGATLRSVITAEAPMSPLRALQMIEPVAAALAVAHDSGLVHRDVKPENVLISDLGVIKVADFGLARTISTQTATATQGLLIGTVSYLPPELLTSGRAHSWSDVYSTGVMLFEMLTGRKPYTGDTPITVAYKHVNENIPAPSKVLARTHPAQARREPIPDYLDALVLACTRRNPEARPPDGRELLRRIRRARRALERGIGDDETLSTIMFPTRSLPWSIPVPATGTAGDLAAAATAAQVTIPPSQPTPVEPPRKRTPITNRSVPVPAPPRQDFVDDEPDYDDYDEIVPVGAQAAPRPVSATHRRRRGLLLGLIGLLVLTLGAGGWWLTTGRYTITPSVVNQTQDEAIAIAQANDMPIVFTEEYSETVPAGLVISSVPAPGDKVIRGSEIAAVVSLGPERFAVPELVGLTIEDAKSALEAVSLRAGTISEAWDESVPAGVVVWASHAAGEPLKRDTLVDLTVSKGREPLTVPNVTNKPQAEAEEILTAAGFTVAVVGEEFHETVPKGAVISQAPDSGTGHRGDQVQLVISKGKEIVLVKLPDVLGDDMIRATAELTDAGFSVARDPQTGVLPLRVGKVLLDEDVTMPDGSTIPRGTELAPDTELPTGTKIYLQKR